MAKTTNYEQWLADLTMKGDEDVLDLFNSVNNFERVGRFYTSKEVLNDGYQYLVKVDGLEQSLFLESDEAKFAFLEHVKRTCTDASDEDIDVWYKMKQELGRVD